MSELKKILLITRPIAPPWDEASKNFAYYLAKNISTVNFTLLTNGTMADLPQNIVQRPIYTSNHLDWMQRLRLLKLISIRNQFDIMHFMLTPSKLNAFGFKNFIRSKSASRRTKTVQTIATLREDLLKDSDYKKILFADLIITYSDYAKNKLASLGFKNVQRVYPGIDLEYYSPAPKNLETLKKLGFDEADFIATYPGEYVRLGAMDDITDMIIQNVAIFREKNIKILLACRLKNDPEAAQKKNEIIEKLEKNKALDRVVFVDIFPDMATLYNLSDVIIFPVRNMHGKFDVPLAAIEPMACAKPVIISDLPILQEFANQDNSVIIKRGNAGEMRDAILDFQANPEKRTSLGKNARKFAQENFDIQKIARTYQEIYETL